MAQGQYHSGLLPANRLATRTWMETDLFKLLHLRLGISQALGAGECGLHKKC
jgi:hypothetical protein